MMKGFDNSSETKGKILCIERSSIKMIMEDNKEIWTKNIFSEIWSDREQGEL